MQVKYLWFASEKCGIVQLCQPENEEGEGAKDVQPQQRTSVKYPSKHYFDLDVVGLQAFVLTASTKPLAPYKEWRSGAGVIPWPEMSLANLGGAVFGPLNRTWRGRR